MVFITSSWPSNTSMRLSSNLIGFSSTTCHATREHHLLSNIILGVIFPKLQCFVRASPQSGDAVVYSTHVAFWLGVRRWKKLLPEALVSCQGHGMVWYLMHRVSGGVRLMKWKSQVGVYGGWLAPCVGLSVDGRARLGKKLLPAVSLKCKNTGCIFIWFGFEWLSTHFSVRVTSRTWWKSCSLVEALRFLKVLTVRLTLKFMRHV